MVLLPNRGHQAAFVKMRSVTESLEGVLVQQVFILKGAPSPGPVMACLAYKAHCVWGSHLVSAISWVGWPQDIFSVNEVLYFQLDSASNRLT